jgi:RNA polymerase sigma factor (sigma-70 family)
MLGSLHDAEDALQETMLRAWKGSDRYEPRAQLTAWLHAIATNVCLTAIVRRRARPAQATEDLEHLQPYPDRPAPPAGSLTGGRLRSSVGGSALSESSRNAEPNHSEARRRRIFALLAAL